VHFTDEGRRDGPVIVLMHNDKGNLRIFDAWVPVLADRYRLVRFDLPGYGLTGVVANGDYSAEHDGEIIDGLMRSLGIGRFALVGTSVSAVSAFHYAAQHPDRVTALVLANAGGLPRLANQKFNVPPGNPLRRWIYRYYVPRSVFEQGVGKAFHEPSKIPGDFVDQVYQLNNRKDRYQESARRFSSYMSTPAHAAETLGRVNAPVLLLWGRYSELDPSESDRFRQLLLASKLVEQKIYEDTGHAIFVEAAVRSASDVGDFVTRAVAMDQSGTGGNSDK
jgi:pimeloyl-ACP methyl ester carboxylesterase